MQERWKDGPTTVRTLVFAYDAANNMRSAGDSAADYDFVVDALDRLTGVTVDHGSLSDDVVWTQSFDANSNRTSLSAAIGAVADFENTYAYDELHRLTQIVQQGQAGM